MKCEFVRWSVVGGWGAGGEGNVCSRGQVKVPDSDVAANAGFSVRGNFEVSVCPMVSCRRVGGGEQWVCSRLRGDNSASVLDSRIYVRLHSERNISASKHKQVLHETVVRFPRSWANLMKENDWETCAKKDEFKRMIVGLLFFHANIQVS